MKTLLLSWGLNGNTGWGWNGSNVARHASLAGWRVFSDGGIDWSSLPPEWRLEQWDVSPHRSGQTYDAAIYAAGNGVVPLLVPGLAKRFLVSTFLEDTKIDPKIIAGYNQADAVIVGSKWNHDLLVSRGLDAGKCHVLYQGATDYVYVDGLRNTNSLADMTTRRIFSGGKLEFRKGHDIVVAAFREYLKSDPTAVLVTAWQNTFLATMKGIDASGYVKGWPAFLPNGQLDIVGWCERNGIPRKNVVDVGMPPSWALQRVMASCDVAVFPNRAEGGNNLVAAECAAIGVATAATLCTGQSHLREWTSELFEIPHTPVTLRGHPFKGTEGWGEADLGSVVKAMDHHFYPYPKVPTWDDYAAGVLRLCEC